MLAIFVKFIHIIVCVGLIAIVLLQADKGEGLAGAFGGGASSTVFGERGSGGFLSKLTTGLAIIFMLTSLVITLWGPRWQKEAERNATAASMPAVDVGASTAPVVPAEAMPAIPPAPAEAVKTAEAPTAPSETAKAVAPETPVMPAEIIPSVPAEAIPSLPAAPAAPTAAPAAPTAAPAEVVAEPVVTDNTKPAEAKN